jgi:hypothetical protein
MAYFDFCLSLSSLRNCVWKNVSPHSGQPFQVLGIWSALRKWEHLLRDVHFTIHTDHKNLKFLNLNTQEFDFTVHHIDGEANIVADAFSRLCTQDGEEDNEDDQSSILSEFLFPSKWRSHSQ